MNPVAVWARELWRLRDVGGGRVQADRAAGLGRELAGVVQQRVAECDSYDPESDVRVLWAREVLAAAHRREPRCLASGNLEASVAFLLGTREAVVELCGKDKAAGEAWGE